MESTLAIVIPAYKPAFLADTLRSISAQTDRDFVLYIGDDASPWDVAGEIAPFRSRMPIVYRRFDVNLGGRDLVGQWERCIGMVEKEQWILLFSDDDLMPPDAVERFHKALPSGGEFFRFPLDRVDATGHTEYVHAPLPAGVSSAEEYITGYFKGQRPSAACEYVFSKRLFQELGMVHFPLAWCSDIATWYSYARNAGGVVNLEGAPMMWRNAPGVNISNTGGLQDTKMEALIRFVGWLDAEYAGARDNDFRRALRIFITTNLNDSFGGNYSRKNLWRLSGTFSKIDRRRAFELLLKYMFQ